MVVSFYNIITRFSAIKIFHVLLFIYASLGKELTMQLSTALQLRFDMYSVLYFCSSFKGVFYDFVI